MEAMLWIKEVDMIDSVDDLESSRSIREHHFPNCKTLDAKIASVLIQEEVNLAEQEGPIGRPISSWNTDCVHEP